MTKPKAKHELYKAKYKSGEKYIKHKGLSKHIKMPLSKEQKEIRWKKIKAEMKFCDNINEIYYRNLYILLNNGNNKIPLPWSFWKTNILDLSNGKIYNTYSNREIYHGLNVLDLVKFDNQVIPKRNIIFDTILGFRLFTDSSVNKKRFTIRPIDGVYGNEHGQFNFSPDNLFVDIRNKTYKDYSDAISRVNIIKEGMKCKYF